MPVVGVDGTVVLVGTVVVVVTTIVVVVGTVVGGLVVVVVVGQFFVQNTLYLTSAPIDPETFARTL